MSQLKTKYGVIESYDNLEMHDSDTPASLLMTARMEMETSCGSLIPLYQVEDHGRQQHRPVLFHRNGNVRRVPLQEAITVHTRYGDFPAELVLFYKDGALKKLFPLAGKLSGYWSEKNEYELAPELSMDLPSGPLSAKIINMGFYASGNVRSITLWPEERVSVACRLGTIETRTGIAFYEDGTIRSLEPARPTLIETPIGTMKAFDNDPEGINGDLNSLQFDRAGNLSALCSTTDRIIVTTCENEHKIYAPTEKASLCSDLVKISTPLLIEFIGGKVRFNKSSRDEYDIATCAFKIEKYTAETVVPTYEC